MLSEAIGHRIDAPFTSLVDALPLEGRHALFEGRHVIVQRHVVRTTNGIEVDHGVVR